MGKHLEIIVEEPSMEAVLQALLPRIAGTISFAIYAHQSKSELLNELPKRMRGYARLFATNPWYRDNCKVLVIVDRDGDDCPVLKQTMEDAARANGLETRTSADPGKYAVVNRIAVQELEAWYFGDWEAVRAAYPRVPATIPERARYRDPDAIESTWESFQRVMQRSGYFPGGLRKIQAARAIGSTMEPSRNTSHSFRAFYAVLTELIGLA